MQKWYEESVSEANKYVVSSRIRLVRNSGMYPFPAKISETDAKNFVDDTITNIKSDLESSDDIFVGEKQKMNYIDLTSHPEIQKMALKERRAINGNIASKKGVSYLMLSESEDLSIVLNGDDHIRLQYLSRGEKLADMWTAINKLDDHINDSVSYAFDDKYGYMTSFLTNIGTGMRANVVLHLPGICADGKFRDLVEQMNRFGINMRGVFGHGNKNYGSLYDISNSKTLGMSEREIIELILKAAQQLSSQEEKARSMALRSNTLRCTDESYKSYGVLKYARRISLRDALVYLAQIMRGIEDGVLPIDSTFPIYKLILECQSANIMSTSDRPLKKEEVDEARATYIREHLPDIK